MLWPGAGKRVPASKSFQVHQNTALCLLLARRPLECPLAPASEAVTGSSPGLGGWGPVVTEPPAGLCWEVAFRDSPCSLPPPGGKAIWMLTQLLLEMGP